MPPPVPTGNSFTIPLGGTAQEQIQELQKIKDAMARAVFNQVETSGIEKDLTSFAIWHIIYLEADHLLTVLMAHTV